MTLLQSLILGAVQGLTEFLPVSSSGHLVLLKEVFEIQEVPVLFDVILHVSTLIVVIIVFRVTVWRLLRSSLRWVARKSDDSDSENLRMAWVILLATVVTGTMGVLIGELEINRYPAVVSGLFIFTGLLLIAGHFARPTGTYRDIGVRTALITGFAQGLGVFPGISRSGITIAGSLFAGLKREHAGEFAFLLSIPAILGALVLTLRDVGELAEAASPAVIAVGAGSSLIVGFAALALLLRLVRRGRLYLFSLYLIPLGVVGIIVF